MRRMLFLALLVVLAGQPVLAQVYRPNEALGKRLSKVKSLSTPNNAGGRNILENSCLNKKDFSISASQKLLDQCDQAKATADFTAKYGQPDHTFQAPGHETVLEYFLRFKDNDYHVKLFVGCSNKETDLFAMVECITERHRFMPGAPPDKKPGFFGHIF